MNYGCGTTNDSGGRTRGAGGESGAWWLRMKRGREEICMTLSACERIVLDSVPGNRESYSEYRALFIFVISAHFLCTAQIGNEIRPRESTPSKYRSQADCHSQVLPSTATLLYLPLPGFSERLSRLPAFRFNRLSLNKQENLFIFFAKCVI